MAQVSGFAAVADRNARLLILGSMPGLRSLAAAEYYAHPRNAFWPIMAQLLGFPLSTAYEDRLGELRNAGVALWDVLGSCYREGSLDASIREHDLQPNDFAAFLDSHRDIRALFFNGGASERIWSRRVLPNLDPTLVPEKTHRLPSTSPAYAAMPFAQKLTHWSNALAPLLR